MQTAVGETTYPVMGLIKWQKVYDSMLATPLTARHVVAAHLLLRRVPAGHDVRRCSCWCWRRSASSSPGGGRSSRSASQVLIGMAFATLVYGFTTRLNSPEGFGVLFRLGVFPLFLFSGAFFPVANLGDVGEWVAKLTPLWHGVNLSRMFCIDNVDWPLAAVNVAVPGRASRSSAGSGRSPA